MKNVIINCSFIDKLIDVYGWDGLELIFKEMDEDSYKNIKDNLEQKFKCLLKKRMKCRVIDYLRKQSREIKTISLNKANKNNEELIEFIF